MCSVLPNSDKANIYRKLVAAGIPRTSKRSSSTFTNVSNPRNAPTRRVAWGTSKNTSIPTRVNNKHNTNSVQHNNNLEHRQTSRQQSYRAAQEETGEAEKSRNNPHIGLEIKIRRKEHTTYPDSERVDPESKRFEHSWTKSPHYDCLQTEVYDDDMISVWSSFDLKSYDLDGGRNSARAKYDIDGGTNSARAKYDIDGRGNSARAKSAPPRRPQYHCGNATLLYSESRGSSQCSKRERSNVKLKQVLAETTPKLVNSVHLDYDLFLKALKLEKCVPAGVSDKRIRRDIDRFFNKQSSPKFHNCRKY